jgi:hypothetical protein
MTPGSVSWRFCAAAVALGLTLGAAGCGGGSEKSSAANGSSDKTSSSSVPSSDADGGPVKQASKPAKPQHAPTKGPRGSQRDVLSNLPGSPTPGCVAVGKERDVRSGDMGAGPFDAARANFSKKSESSRQVSLYFIPTHSSDLKGITVTAKNSRGAHFTQKSKVLGDAEQWKFYQLQLNVPAAGTWTFKATTGEDNGCWVVDLA